MTTENPLQDATAIKRYLDEFDRTTAERGANYFKCNAVLQLRCDEPGARYSATVRGSMDYEVTLFYGSGEWDGECTCPVGYECKHAYAALLAFQKQAADFPSALMRVNPPTQSKKAKKPSKSSAKSSSAPLVPLVPVSPLVARVTESLGRQPNATEADFLRKVQALL